MSDRKYRQSGYQDSPRESRESSRDSYRDRPRAERPPGPRGRGLGKPTATVFRCAVCGEKQLAATVVELATACWKCGTDLHTCTHCRYFDTSASGECRQGEAAYVAAKAKRNTCGFFEIRLTQEISRSQGGDSPSAAKTAFDALFKT